MNGNSDLFILHPSYFILVNGLPTGTNDTIVRQRDMAFDFIPFEVIIAQK